jgi:multidrug efflux pump subunit AcrA (membrane-fusion protein)
MVLFAAGVFLYEQYLTSALASKDAALKTAQAQIDQTTVASFVQLQQQLTEGEALLQSHPALSQFLDALGLLTVAEVRFSSLNVSINDDDTATVALAGTAASFNALAAQSAALATDSRIKNAVFSGIAITKSGVGFQLSATLDASLVEVPATGFAAAAAPPPPAVPESASSTASTTAP